MKTFVRVIFLLGAILSLGLLFILYLYLHKENKSELQNIVKRASLTGQKIKRQLSRRQSEMQSFIKSLGKDTFEIKDIGEKFISVSTRTIRRDLEKLEKAGFVKQIGKTRDTLYKVLND